MAVELITGHAGEPHISSDDAGHFNAGVVSSPSAWGEEGPELSRRACVVLPVGSVFNGVMSDANTFVIDTGDAVFQGRHVRVASPETVTIESGTQGQKRNDIVGLLYTNSGGIESSSMHVYKGTPSSTTPEDPAYPTGSILDGAAEAFFPLYRIHLEGLAVDWAEWLPDITMPIDVLTVKMRTANGDIEDLQDGLADATRFAGYTHQIVNVLGSTVTMLLRRYGNIVTASVINTVTPPAANTVYNCGTIPQGYRPQQTVFQGGPSVSNARFTNGHYRWEVNASGAVRFLASASGIQEAPLSLAWCTSQPFPS